MDNQYRALSALLETISNPSSYARASAIPVSVALDKGLTPKADTAILQAFSALGF
jgi:hypothetical protein